MRLLLRIPVFLPVCYSAVMPMFLNVSRNLTLAGPVEYKNVKLFDELFQPGSLLRTPLFAAGAVSINILDLASAEVRDTTHSYAAYTLVVNADSLVGLCSRL